MARFQVALFWSFFATGGRQAITALLTFVLAALLGPEAFGVIGIAAAFVHFIMIFLEQGLGTAIVQREELHESHKNAAFWMTLALSAALAGICLAISGWWAGVNDLPELAPVIQALAILIPLEGLTVVQQALLRRQMEFRKLALRANLSVLIGGVTGVALALNGFGVWSMVAQQLTTAFSGALLLWAVSGWRPGFSFDRKSASDLVGYSLGALLGRVAVFVSNRSDAILMGIFFGPVAVGLYRLADRLMGLVVDLSSRSIQAVALPEFSRFQSDPRRLSESALRCLRTSASIAIPPLAVMAAGSDALTGLLGERWSDSAIPLSLLCGVGVVRSMTVVTGPIMRALGRPYAHAIFMWCHAAPSALAFWAVAAWLSDSSVQAQANGIALSRVALFAAVFLPANLVILLRLAEIRLRDVLAALAPATAAGVAGALVVLALGTIAAPSEERLAILLDVFRLVSGGSAAIATLLALDARLRSQLLRQLNRRLQRGAGSDEPDRRTVTSGGEK